MLTRSLVNVLFCAQADFIEVCESVGRKQGFSARFISNRLILVHLLRSADCGNMPMVLVTTEELNNEIFQQFNVPTITIGREQASIQGDEKFTLSTTSKHWTLIQPDQLAERIADMATRLLEELSVIQHSDPMQSIPVGGAAVSAAGIPGCLATQ